LVDFIPRPYVYIFAPISSADWDHFIEIWIALDQVLKTFLDYPCDISVGTICSQSPKKGQGMNNIADGAKFND
jgi:hypothetical protein